MRKVGLCAAAGCVAVIALLLLAVSTESTDTEDGGDLPRYVSR